MQFTVLNTVPQEHREVTEGSPGIAGNRAGLSYRGTGSDDYWQLTTQHRMKYKIQRLKQHHISRASCAILRILYFILWNHSRTSFRKVTLTIKQIPEWKK